MTVILPIHFRKKSKDPKTSLGRVEFSTFSILELRVAKASQGLFPPPFLITIQYVFELMGKYNIRFF